MYLLPRASPAMRVACGWAEWAWGRPLTNEDWTQVLEGRSSYVTSPQSSLLPGRPWWTEPGAHGRAGGGPGFTPRNNGSGPSQGV